MQIPHAISVLVNTSPAAVEGRLRNVEAWSCFLIDVGEVTKAGHERYDFKIITSKHVRTSRIAVRWHPHQSSFTWTALKGPSFEGSIRLLEHDGGWTRLNVAVTCWPEGFVANVTDLMMPSRHRSGIDEAALRHLLEDVPESLTSDSQPGRA